MGNVVLHFSSAVIAFCSYGLLLLFLLFYTGSNKSKPTRYGAPQKTRSEYRVSLVELAPQSFSVEKKEEEAEKKLPPAKESASRTPQVGIGLNQLFKQVEASIPIKEKMKPSDIHDESAKKRQGKQAKQEKQPDALQENLKKILADTHIKSSLTFSPPTGKYDEFYAKISEILHSRWNPVGFAPNEESKAIITITSKGEFSFKISKKSGNSAFDTALLEFLEQLKEVQFPPFLHGEKSDIEVTFKTEG
ncbi:MAG: energy transducer TonB [Wolinella sp.]